MYLDLQLFFAVHNLKAGLAETGLVLLSQKMHLLSPNGSKNRPIFQTCYIIVAYLVCSNVFTLLFVQI